MDLKEKTTERLWAKCDELKKALAMERAKLALSEKSLSVVFTWLRANGFEERLKNELLPFVANALGVKPKVTEPLVKLE